MAVTCVNDTSGNGSNVYRVDGLTNKAVKWSIWDVLPGEISVFSNLSFTSLRDFYRRKRAKEKAGGNIEF
jgi:hypothetical protein